MASSTIIRNEINFSSFPLISAEKEAFIKDGRPPSILIFPFFKIGNIDLIPFLEAGVCIISLYFHHNSFLSTTFLFFSIISYILFNKNQRHT